MFKAIIPLKFWRHCLKDAIYLINKLIFSLLGISTPYKKMYNKKPPLNDPKLLGCLCYAKDYTNWRNLGLDQEMLFTWEIQKQKRLYLSLSH